MRVLATQSHCTYCKVSRTVVRLVPNHTLYFLVSLMSFGIYLIPWAIVTAYNHFVLGWRCEICGTKLRK